MSTLSTAEEATEQVDWSRLGHVYVFANGKGGVGKTTAASNVAGLAAADGLNVLLIDLNGQGNVAEDLGYTGTQVDDAGKALFAALTMDAPLVPAAKQIRPQLDVVPGGKFIRRVTSSMSSEMADPQRANHAVLALARTLVPIAEQYDVIVIDSPPENPPLVQLALGAARWVVVPMKSDDGSRKGLRELAMDFKGMRSHNPYLSLLGVFVFASGSGATRIRAEVHANVEQDLGGAAHMFSSMVRHSEAVAKDARKYGRLAHELEAQASNNPTFWQIRSGRADASQVVTRTSASVAEDFASLTREIFGRAAQLQAQMTETGVWP
jgi:chromosome partitioning protein